MGRRRKHDKHLPQRVYHRGKTYYFVDHAGTWHSLGRTVSDMYRACAEMLEEHPITTMGDLFDRYLVEVVPGKAERTQRDNRYEMPFLRAALRHMVPSEFKPRDGYAYYNRVMTAAVKDENSGLKERFQFRDLRAKSASDDTAEAASKRLGHADPRITERVYRRKAERAKPLR